MFGGGLAAQVFVNRPRAKRKLQQVCLLLHSTVIIRRHGAGVPLLIFACACMILSSSLLSYIATLVFFPSVYENRHMIMIYLH
jgi:hypothetical protein